MRSGCETPRAPASPQDETCFCANTHLSTYNMKRENGQMFKVQVANVWALVQSIWLATLCSCSRNAQFHLRAKIFREKTSHSKARKKMQVRSANLICALEVQTRCGSRREISGIHEQDNSARKKTKKVNQPSEFFGFAFLRGTNPDNFWDPREISSDVAEALATKCRAQRSLPPPTPGLTRRRDSHF